MLTKIKPKWPRIFSHFSQSGVLLNSLQSQNLYNKSLVRLVFKTSNYAKSHRQPSVDFSLKDIREDEDISLKKGISEKTVKKDNANGYRLLLICVFGGIFCIVKASIHTLFLKDLQKMVQLVDKKGEPKQLPQNLEQLFLQVIAEMQLNNKQTDSLRAFLNFFDEKTTSLGNFTYKNGFVVGLPKIFLLESIDDVDLNNLTVGKKNLSVDQQTTERASELKNSMVLSGSAKKFLIAREMNRGLHVFPGLEETKLLLVLPLSFYVFHFFVFKNLNLELTSRFTRLIWTGICSLFPGLVYITARNIQRDSIERNIDLAASSMGPDYASGGVEWYSKMMARHLALRDLLPDGKGKLQYNLKGEEFQPLIFNKHRPLSTRKNDCQKVYENLRSEKPI